MGANLGGRWATFISAVNTLIAELVRPAAEMARVIGAVAKGDLSQTMVLDVDGRALKGQFLRTASTANWRPRTSSTAPASSAPQTPAN